jgi:RNA-directed DNA polymerase
MPFRHNNLFGHIANFQSLIAATKRAAKGKRCNASVAKFVANTETNVLQLERELLGGTYEPGKHRNIVIHDPKTRVIGVAPFRDRVVHQALIGVIAPIFERGFITDTFANRQGYGTHRAIARFEQHRSRNNVTHVLKADLYRYFAAIDHEILKSTLQRRIKCKKTLALCERIIDGAEGAENVNILFPGDDLLTSENRSKGLPLGNLTSQFFANLYLDRFDHWVTEVLKLPYVRYVDDFAVFAKSKVELIVAKSKIEHYLEKLRLLLHPRKTTILPITEPARFLGFDLLANGQRRLADENVRRFKNRLRVARKSFQNGTLTKMEVQQQLGAWIAHAKHANTVQLRHTLFKGGWFDPLWENLQPVEVALP